MHPKFETVGTRTFNTGTTSFGNRSHIILYGFGKRTVKPNRAAGDEPDFHFRFFDSKLKRIGVFYSDCVI